MLKLDELFQLAFYMLVLLPSGQMHRLLKVIEY